MIHNLQCCSLLCWLRCIWCFWSLKISLPNNVLNVFLLLDVMFGTPSVCRVFARGIEAHFCMCSSRSASPFAQVAECIQRRCRRRRTRRQGDCNLPSYPWHYMTIRVQFTVHLFSEPVYLILFGQPSWWGRFFRRPDHFLAASSVNLIWLHASNRTASTSPSDSRMFG